MGKGLAASIQGLYYSSILLLALLFFSRRAPVKSYLLPYLIHYFSEGFSLNLLVYKVSMLNFWTCKTSQAPRTSSYLPLLAYYFHFDILSSQYRSLSHLQPAALPHTAISSPTTTSGAQTISLLQIFRVTSDWKGLNTSFRTLQPPGTGLL